MVISLLPCLPLLTRPVFSTFASRLLIGLAIREEATFSLNCNLGTSQVALVVKNLPANVGDTRDADSTPRSGRSPRGGNGNPVFLP
jgi:hypothetical protein